MSSPSSPYGRTSGTSQRDPRSVMERLMVFRPTEEIAALRAEREWTTGERNSRTLAKDVDFRVVLTVLHEGAELDEHHGDARVSLHLIEGRAVLRAGGDSVSLDPGELAVIDAGEPWTLHADQDCAVLLTLAWPPGRAQP